MSTKGQEKLKHDSDGNLISLHEAVYRTGLFHTAITDLVMNGELKNFGDSENMLFDPDEVDGLELVTLEVFRFMKDSHKEMEENQLHKEMTNEFEPVPQDPGDPLSEG